MEQQDMEVAKLNSVNIIGNIGHDLDLKHTNSGKAVINFNIAVNEGRDKTLWFRVTAWEKQAEAVANHCGKGSKVAVTGALTTNEYQNDQGATLKTVEIIGHRIDFLGDGNQKQGNSRNKQNEERSDSSEGNYTQNNQNSSQGQNNGYQKQGEDPFESNNDSIDISDDDLPFS